MNADANASAKLKNKGIKLLATDNLGYMCWLNEEVWHNRGMNTQVDLRRRE